MLIAERCRGAVLQSGVGDVEQGVAEALPLQRCLLTSLKHRASVTARRGHLHVRNSGVAILLALRPRRSQRRSVLLKLSLNPEALHLVHFRRALPKVLAELAAIVLVAGVEGDEQTMVHLLAQLYQVLVVRRSTVGDQQTREGEALPEGVSGALLLGEDLGDDEQVVEEEHLSLV